MKKFISVLKSFLNFFFVNELPEFSIHDFINPDVKIDGFNSQTKRILTICFVWSHLSFFYEEILKTKIREAHAIVQTEM